MRRFRLRGLVLPLGLPMAVLMLAGCGRVGPVRAPGPASEIVYPRIYPYYPNQPRNAAQAASPNGPSPTGSLLNGGGSNTPGAPGTGLNDPSTYINRF